MSTEFQIITIIIIHHQDVQKNGGHNMKKFKTDTDLLMIENGQLSYSRLIGNSFSQKIRVNISPELELLLTSISEDRLEKAVFSNVKEKIKSTPVKKIIKSTKQKTNPEKIITDICKKSGYLVLSYCKVTSIDKMAVIYATNNDIYIEYKSCFFYSGQDFLCNPADLFNLINKNGDNKIIQENDLSVKVNGKNIFTDTNVRKFPEFIFNDNSIEKTLIDIGPILKASTHASKDSIKPVFNGIYLCQDGIISTDSRRLFMSKYNLPDSYSDIIPLDTIKLLKDDFYYSTSDKKEYCKIELSSLTIYSRIIQGQFPNYKQVIPANDKFIGNAEVNKKDFEELLKTVKTFTKEPAYKMVLSFEENKILISTNKNEVETNFSIDAGCDIPIGFLTAFNIAFIQDILRNIKDETVLFQFSGKMSPMIVNSGEETFVIMPIQVKPQEYKE